MQMPSEEEIEAFRQRIHCCVPFLLLSIAPFVAIYGFCVPEALLAPWWVFVAGAAGWWLAFILRVPVILASKGMVNQSQRQNITVLISGPAEESVRIAMLFFFDWNRLFAYTFALGPDFPKLQGLGWTGLELVFTVVQCLASIQLLQGVNRGDAQAIEAFKALGAQTGRPDPLAVDPFWGVLERCSAHAIHISMSLYGALSPWSLLVTAPLHSFLNWFTVTMVPKIGILIVELLLFCAAVALMAAALAIWGH